MGNHYIKFYVEYNKLLDYLLNLGAKRVNFFIDIPSVARGLYNKEVILYEINSYIESQTVSNSLITELKEWLGKMWDIYAKHFNKIFFVLFYDDGVCQQNKAISRLYKKRRTVSPHITIVKDEELEIFRHIKKYYYELIESEFEIDNASTVFYWREYEADVVPHFCIKYSLFESDNPDTINVMFSVDKDLLQTCKFENTIQCAARYTPSQRKLDFNIYNRDNAFAYIYKKFKPGILKADHIPLCLSIAGDAADDIDGVKGYGIAKAAELIQKANLPPILNPNEKQKYPKVIQDNWELINFNFKLISFDEQLTRMKGFLRKYISS